MNHSRSGDASSASRTDSAVKRMMRPKHKVLTICVRAAIVGWNDPLVQRMLHRNWAIDDELATQSIVRPVAA